MSKETVEEQIQRKLKEQGKDASLDQIREALAKNAAAKKEKRQAKGQAVKDYVKSRIDRAKNVTNAGVNLVKNLKNPGSWVETGKAVVEGEVQNVKELGKMLRALFNHPSFYEHYPELLQEMITPNYARISGRVDPHIPGNMNGDAPAPDTDVPFRDGCFSVPRVAGISLKLVRNSDSASFKLAIDRLYQSISNANNNVKTGTLANYVELIMITRSLVAIIEQGRRAYGTLKKYELLDESVPMAYFAAYGLDYDTFRENAADLRNTLNTVISEMNSRAMFKLDLFNRTISLFRGHYADNPTIKHQDYVFRPITIETPTYDGDVVTIDEISPCLDSISSNRTGITYANYITLLKNELAKLTALEVYSDIRGNIIKAYGLDLFQMEKIPEEYSTISIYNEYMLSAIKNATLCGSPLACTSNLIGLTSLAWLTIDEEITCTETKFSENNFNGIFVDAYKDKISNSEFISSIRLAAASSKLSNDDEVIYDSFGTELCCEMVVPFRTKPSVVTAKNGNTVYNIVLFRYSRMTYLDMYNGGLGSLDVTNAGSVLVSLFLWSAFDWHPMIVFRIGNYDTKDDQWVNMFYIPLWDFANYAWVEKQPLDTYHIIAVKNLYFAPLLYIQKNTQVIPAR